MDTSGANQKSNGLPSNSGSENEETSGNSEGMIKCIELKIKFKICFSLIYKGPDINQLYYAIITNNVDQVNELVPKNPSFVNETLDDENR